MDCWVDTFLPAAAAAAVSLVELDGHVLELIEEMMDASPTVSVEQFSLVPAAYQDWLYGSEIANLALIRTTWAKRASAREQGSMK